MVKLMIRCELSSDRGGKWWLLVVLIGIMVGRLVIQDGYIVWSVCVVKIVVVD